MDPEARDVREGVDHGEEREEVLETPGSQGEVICRTSDPGIRRGGVLEIGEKDVVNKNEDNRGKGAALLDTLKEANAVVWSEGRDKGNVVQKIGDGMKEPEGKTLFTEYCQNIVMEQGVKSFNVIKEEDKKVFVVKKGGVEELVKH